MCDEKDSSPDEPARNGVSAHDGDHSAVKFLNGDDVELVIKKWKSRNRLKRRLIIGFSIGSGCILLLAVGILLAIVILQSKHTCSCAKTTISNMTYKARSSGLSGNDTNESNSTAAAMNMVASPFSDCGSQAGSIVALFAEDCILTGDRCRFDRHSTGRLDVLFTLSRPVQRLTLGAKGIADPVPFLEVPQNVEPKDVCQSLQCPLQPNNQYSFLITQTPPKDMLFWIQSQRDVKTRVKYELLDENGNMAICVQLLIILT